MQVEKETRHMGNKILFFESTIVDYKNIGNEKSNQNGKQEKKAEYVERYYNWFPRKPISSYLVGSLQNIC